jgi:serine/threonine protein kinase/formylglycine-generating enzyme required for sulfatase activity
MPGSDEKLFAKLAVAAGHITREQLEECLQIQESSAGNKTLWEIMVDRSYLDVHTTNTILEKVEEQHAARRTAGQQKVEKFFGDIAVSRGYCSAEQMDRAIAEQKSRMEGGRNQRLGELCVEMGVLTAEQVALVLNEQNRSILVCEGCGAAYSVEGFPAGKRWRCRVCNNMLEVPGVPGFASVPIDQLLSEQIERSGREEVAASPAGPPAAPAGPRARAEKTRFGNYYIIEKIAQGGMGIIYKARQRGLDRIVALKVLLAGESATKDTIERFYLEAKSAAKLRHPNIVPIHEVGIHDGKHFFTMDFIHGQNLRHMIINEKINLHWALEVTAKVARALHYAHEQGIVHRDVKPENIILDDTGEPQITDFGLAKDIGLDANLTRAGVVMGTPAYMSPEQARGERSEIDHRTDVYSLGAVLYELLTGRQMFEFEGPIGLNSLLKTLSEDPVLPRRINPRIPREVETVVLKAIEKDPERRYEGAKEFADDIERYLTGEPIMARPPSFSYRTWKKIKKYKVVSVSMLSALVAIVAVAVYFIGQRVEENRRIDLQVRTYLDDARQKYGEAEFLSSKDLCNKALALRPGNQEAQSGLNKVELALEQEKKLRAERDAKERAVVAAQEGGRLLNAAAEALGAGRRDDAKTTFFEAIRNFDRARMDDKDNEDARRGRYDAALKLGQLYMQDKDYGVAAFVFSFAEDLGVDDKNARKLVESARKARRRMQEFDTMLSKASELMASGSWDEALRQLQIAAGFEGISEEKRLEVLQQIREASYSMYFWEGETERKKGNAEAAIKAYKEAEAFKTTPEVLERLKGVHCTELLREGNELLARAEYAAALAAFDKARQYAANLDEIDKLVRRCRDTGYRRLMELAAAARASQSWDEALSQARKALSLKPGDARAAQLEKDVSAARDCPGEMVFVFSGKYPVGSAVLDDRNNPCREVLLNGFYIDRFEVTNEEYREFVVSDGYARKEYWDPEIAGAILGFSDRTGKPGPATWENGSFPAGKDKFPVTGVCWYEARAYARWKGKRLPTEEEWETAASYDAAAGRKRVYPWGDDWNAANGNLKDDEVTRVGSFPKDVSPAGCFDMGGNAFEWTGSVYDKDYRVIRGGSVGLSESTLKRFARTTKRKCPKPSYRSPSTGFRCAESPGG